MRDAVADAVIGFAKTMGMENLRLPESGLLQFSFEQAGTFVVEDKEEGTALYLFREVPEYDLAEKLNRALHLCHYKESRGFDVQSALHEGSNLIFLIWLVHEHITVPQVEKVLNHLVNMHEKVMDSQ